MSRREGRQHTHKRMTLQPAPILCFILAAMRSRAECRKPHAVSSKMCSVIFVCLSHPLVAYFARRIGDRACPPSSFVCAANYHDHAQIVFPFREHDRTEISRARLFKWIWQNRAGNCCTLPAILLRISHEGFNQSHECAHILRPVW